MVASNHLKLEEAKKDSSPRASERTSLAYEVLLGQGVMKNQERIEDK